jgi:hypothetical protein
MPVSLKPFLGWPSVSVAPASTGMRPEGLERDPLDRGQPAGLAVGQPAAHSAAGAGQLKRDRPVDAC